jgi:hypothetical protein
MATTNTAAKSQPMRRPTFDRARPSMGCSLARWRHRKDHTELNNQLWAAVFQKDFLLQKTKTLADDDGPPASALNIRTSSYRNVGHNMAALRHRVNETNSWERLFTLLMAVSALERYMLAITTAAVESDPLRTPGFPKLLDGLTLKKKGIEISRPDLTPIIKGSWPSRIAALERLFGSVPDKLKDSQSELETIRRMRNSIAHDFGSEDNNGIMPPSVSLIVGARADRLAVPRRGLSQDRLVRWLGLLTDISIELDAQLTTQHVGDYEIPAIYFDWKKSPDAYEKSLNVTLTGIKKSHDQRFSNFISQALDWGFGSTYVRGMEKYIAGL